MLTRSQRQVLINPFIAGLPNEPKEPANIKEGFIFDGTPHLVHKTKDNALKIHAILDNEEKILHSFTTGAIGDKYGFSCTVLTDTYVCVSAMMGNVYSTQLPFKKGGMAIIPLAALDVIYPVKEGMFYLLFLTATLSFGVIETIYFRPDFKILKKCLILLRNR